MSIVSLLLSDFGDTRLLLLASSVISYIIFNRYEPSKVWFIAVLLLAIPGLLVAPLRCHFPTLAETIAATFITHWSLLLLMTIGYRISPLHPLARFPGPILCKMSKGWLAYLSARDQKIHTYVKKLHDMYGDVVRIGPNELSIIPKETVSNILGPKGLPRGPYYDTREHEEGTSLDGIKEYTVHAVRRRPWARGMNSTAMKYYEGVIKEETGNLIHGLRERKSKEVDISAWMSFFSFDAMGRMSFSYDLRMLKDGRDNHGLCQQIENGLIEAAWISHVPWLVPFLKYIPSASKSWEEIKAVGETLVRRRAQDGSIHPDIFYYLMNEDGQEITKPVIEVCAIDGMLAIIAGSDTSATTLSHLWYCLLSNPACFSQLRSEVDNVFPLGEDPLNDLSKLGTMSYLNACINEALRLYPPVLAALQRRVKPDRGGVMVGDHFIPPETQVSLYAYAIHRDPSHFWPIPDQFWPDRWLSQEEYTLPSGDRIASVITDHEVFIPFSAGPMGCVGKNVAMAEMRAVVSTVVQQFDMSVANQNNLAKWEEGIREVFVTSRGTLPVVLEPRHS